MKRLTDLQDKRRKVWKHNSFFGHARMMQTQCETILHSPTVTPETRDCVSRIRNETQLLMKLLKTRIDQ